MKPHTTRRPRLDLRLSVDEAIETAEALWDTYDLAEDTGIERYIAELADQCDAADVGTIGELVEKASEIIKEWAHVTSLTAYTDRESAVHINTARHTIHVLLLSAALHRREDAAVLLAGLPSVVGRSTNKRRHLDGVEVLLLRLEALRRALKGGAGARNASQYVLVEVGATTSEIEHVALADFDNHERPHTIAFCGNGNDVGPRTRPLAPWATHVMSLTLSEHVRMHGDASDRPIAYYTDGASNNPQAAAAVCTNLARAMIDLGIGKGPHRPEPHSILRWRLKAIRESQGIDAAVEASGRPSATALYTFLTMQEPRKSVAKRKKRMGSMLGQ
jgi:hypothetical protein